jgi:hypothetical protein
MGWVALVRMRGLRHADCYCMHRQDAVRSWQEALEHADCSTDISLILEASACLKDPLLVRVGAAWVGTGWGPHPAVDGQA